MYIMKKKNQTAAKAALAGMLTALSIAVLFMGYATGILDLTALAITSVFSAIAVVELGGAYPYMIWAAASLIGFIFLPDKSLAAGYLLFGGIYPVLKLYFERLGRFAEWAAKLAYGAAVLVLLYLLSRFVLSIPQESGWLALALAISYAAFFVIYDYALTAAITLYMRKLRSKLTFLKRLK